MIADLALFKKLLKGAVSVSEKDGAFYCSRMTSEQLKYYTNNPDFEIKAHATAGIRLECDTDAESITLEGTFFPGSSRLFAYFDISVNGCLIAHEGTADLQKTPDFSFTIPLDGTLNRVVIYFPNLAIPGLKRLDFHGATQIFPVEKAGKLLCFGDSITQGYDAEFSSLSYPNQLADAWDLELFNKAIGGETFPPELAKLREPERPDVITVAYGTNDWSKTSKKCLEDSARGFAENLIKTYPDVPVFAILPIWRKDTRQITAAGSFPEAREIIRQAYIPHKQIRILDGLSFVPHVVECFSDGYLHPNDLGFQFMTESILKEIQRLGGIGTVK